MSEQSNEETTAPPAKKMFTFRQSALSAKADKMWSQSKSGFGFGVTPSTHVELEKKSLNDVLGKMAAEKRQREEMIDKNQPVFIFGSKISDRVVKDAEEVSSNGNSAVEDKVEGSKPKTAEELFKNAAQQDKQHDQHDFIAEAKEAAEKKKECDIPSTSIIAVTTGEENDVNVFQTACKLHSFDKEKKVWVERGLAQIKINQRNDNGEVHHRIVARTIGNHRVVINSKIYADMYFERIDQKRLKISATTPDSNTMQIFLITIGFSKTGLSIDEFCATLRTILKNEKLSESLKRKRRADDEPSSEKITRLEKKDSEQIVEKPIPTDTHPCRE